MTGLGIGVLSCIAGVSSIVLVSDGDYRFWLVSKVAGSFMLALGVFYMLL